MGVVHRAQLLPARVEMPLDRAGCDADGAGDLLGGVPLGGEGDDPLFEGGQGKLLCHHDREKQHGDKTVPGVPVLNYDRYGGIFATRRLRSQISQLTLSFFASASAIAASSFSASIHSPLPIRPAPSRQ